MKRMRELTVEECGFASGGYGEPGDQVDQVDDIVVTGVRKQVRDGPGFFADLFGWDSGSFNIHDIGLGGGGNHGHVVINGGIAAGGAQVALPVDENGEVLVGSGLSAGFDPSDGSIDIGAPGVSYEPNGVDPGFDLNVNGVNYWISLSPGSDGIGFYPVPGGEYGEYYWGAPPGSALGPKQ